MQQEYKGFVIRQVNEHDNYFATTTEWGVTMGLNTNGYATLNNAKGAITKYINAARKENLTMIVNVLEE